MKRAILIFLAFVSFMAAQAQGALSFDGVDDYVTTTATVPIGNTARTVEAWIRTTVNANPSTGGVQNVILDWGSLSPNGARFTFCILFSNSIRIEVGGNGISGTLPVNDGNWHHLAVSYDPALSTNRFKLYIDGVLNTQGNTTVAVNTTSTVPLRFGRRVDDVNHFNGDIDEVRVWNVVRTQAEILADMNTEYCTIPAGLVAYYKFNQGTPSGVNTGDTTAIGEVAGSDGTLKNFALQGNTSNWVSGATLNSGVVQGLPVFVSACGSYTTSNGTVITTSGAYADTIVNPSGCDTAITVNLTILPFLTTNISANACGTYTSPSGTIYTSSGVYTDSLIASSGCDSIVVINLTILPTSSSTINPIICNSFTTPSGTVLNSSGVYTDTIPNAEGCDSIITINLTILSNSSSTISPTACDNYVSPSGNIYTSSGTYSNTIANAAGCDSIITINLTINTINTTTTQNSNTLTAQQSGAQYQWLNCQNGYSPINGANSQSFTPNSNGSYAVRIEAGGCVDTSLCTIISGIGILESGLKNISIYPNPSKGPITIEVPKEYGSYSVKFVDLSGRIVFVEYFENVSKVSISVEFEKGVYMVFVQTPKGLHSNRLIIQ